MVTTCSLTKSSAMACCSSNRGTMTVHPTCVKWPTAKPLIRKGESSSLQLQWLSSPTLPPPQPTTITMPKRTTPVPTKMTVAPWPTCHLPVVAMQEAHRCVSKPLSDMPNHKAVPLMQVTFLITLYGTLAGQDTFLILQKKAWTSKQKWLQRHQKWRAGIQ